MKRNNDKERDITQEPYMSPMRRAHQRTRSDDQFNEMLERTPLEKGDRMALILAMFRVFLPALLGVWAAFILILWFFAMR